MNRPRFPLYAKFLLWAALNVLLIAALLYAYAPKGETGLNLFLTQSVRERLISIGREIADELYEVAPAAWPGVIAQRQTIPGVSFTAKAIGSMPPHDEGPRGPGGPGGDPGGGPPRPPPDEFGVDRSHAPAFGSRGPPGFPISIQRATGAGYLVSLPVEAAAHGGPPRRLLVSAHAENLWALLRLLGISRELLFVLMLLAMSSLLWWPFFWRITRTVRGLSGATQKISRGRFDTRVEESRSDELGELAGAINVMAERLEALLNGQRQFMADIAHEVASPVARMQIGLGILESRLKDGDMQALTDVREDLEEMSGMLNELLLFSRARIEAPREAPVSVELLPLVAKVIHTNSDGSVLDIEIPAGVFVMAQPAMLSRALANLVRNAQRYGGTESAPQILATQDGEHVRVSVRDRGPGVPESALNRLGDPFFRPELARSRATGGFGLGLAIVKRCIADCDGEVRFSNRLGGGFEAEILLRVPS